MFGPLLVFFIFLLPSLSTFWIARGISTISGLYWCVHPFFSLTSKWSLLRKQRSAPRRRPMSPVSLMNLDWCCPQFLPDLRTWKFPGKPLTNGALIQILYGSCHSEQADRQMGCHGSQYVQETIRSKVKCIFQCCSWCLLCILIKLYSILNWIWFSCNSFTHDSTFHKTVL